MKTDNASPQAKFLTDYTVPAYLVETVDLTFQLDDHKTKVTAVVDYYRNPESSVQPLVLDGKNLTLLSIHLNNDLLSAADYELTENSLTLKPNIERFTLTIENEIDPANNTSLEGLYKSAGVFCTQCEAEGFRKITYYPDRPDVLAKFTTHIIADQKQYPCLLSNGNQVAQEKVDNKLTKVTWEDPFPKPAYLFALVAGDLDVLEDTYTTGSGRDIKLALYVDKGNLGRAPFAIESLKKAMQWDETRFNLEYDLDIYMIVAVDFFNMGAMENKGLNVFNSKCVLADPKSATDADYLTIEAIVGHEYFHNWTGNRVTCRDWFQLSLKEGLTVFRDQEFSMDLGSRGVNRIQQVKIMRSHQFAEDAGPMAHPIRPESVIEQSNFYTVTVYDKGAEVIRMLHSILGETGFQKGMDLYFERHDGQAVTCDDFVAAMQDANAEQVDLTLFKRWYSQSGTPQVTVAEKYDADTQQYSVTLSQVTKPTAEQAEKQNLHIPVNIALFNQSGEPLTIDQGAEQVLNLTEAEQTFVFDNIKAQPFVSFLRDFSAPVQLHYTYSDEALATLIKAETSGYSRWELTQTLFIQHIKALISNPEHVFPPIITRTVSALLTDPERDNELVAEILKVPSVATLLAEYTQIDIDKIISARDAFIAFLAESLCNDLQATVKELGAVSYAFNAKAIGDRALRNTVLGILAHQSNIDITGTIEAQYLQADNMTDTLGSLAAASIADATLFTKLMSQFEQEWTGDSLVMDKWLNLQATHESPQALANIKALEQHADFTLNNPNRVRALIGAFAMNNPKAFHAKDGSGYQYLADKLIELNAINPQIAARLITPLIQFGSLDDARQALIKAELQRIAKTDQLSNDLYEKITKALGVVNV